MEPTKIEAVKAKIARAQQQLEAQLQALQTSDDWRRTLERMAILGPTSINRFSFRNIMLLIAQKPEVRHAATFNAWREKGRNVKRGEKGLTVLRPRIIKKESAPSASGAEAEAQTRLAGFSYLTVFDINQTEGEALPEQVQPKVIDTPEGFELTANTLREVVAALPGISGITLRAREATDPQSAGGWFDLQTHQIVVITGERSEERSEAQHLKTLFHEVAHALLHGDGAHHAVPTAEVEAESTAFVVAHALGLDTASYSIPYVATWALAGDQKEPTRIVAAVGERIRKASATILNALGCAEVTEAEELVSVMP